MDWALAIEKNRAALASIVAEIFALVGLMAGGTLSRRLYLSAERLLRPTESALRRLIVIAARGLVVKPFVSRPLPKGRVIIGSAVGLKSFPLFDRRKRFEFVKPETPWLVMVKTYSNNPFNPFEQRIRQDPPERDYAFEISRRLAAVKQALENLPREAMRMARWQAKRLVMDRPKFTSPLRPGPPPGYRHIPEKEVDLVLQECHGLAWDAFKEDTS